MNTVRMELEIAQSRWTRDILPGLRSGRRFIVEVPEGRRAVESAWERIDRAETAFHQRNHKSACSHCREAAEALDGYVKDELSGTYAYEEAWSRAHEGIEPHISLFLHEEGLKKGGYDSEEVTAGRADVEQLLFRLRSLAKYAEELCEAEEARAAASQNGQS